MTRGRLLAVLAALLTVGAASWLAFWFEFTETAPSVDFAPILLPLPSDKFVGGRCVPGLDVSGMQSFHVNGRGYRGPDVAVPKPEGTFRVAVAGGPLTFGRDSLDESQLVGSQLQSILVHNVNNRTIEVVTIGPGDGVASVKGGILEMNLGLDIQPDVLVWIVERVDCAPRQAWKRWARVLSSYQGLLLRWEDPRSSDPKEFPSIWEPGELARFLAEAPAPAGSTAWARARDDFAGLYRAQIRDSSDVGLLLAPRSAPPELTAAIQEVAERCQARHVKLLAVPLPHPLEFDSELRALSVASMQGMQGQDPSVGVDFETTTRLVGDLRARKVPAIDVTPVFRAAVDLKRQVLIHFKAHAWTPDAAHLTASQIAAYIFTSGALR